jgi:hypothetical protein
MSDILAADPTVFDFVIQLRAIIQSKFGLTVKRGDLSFQFETSESGSFMSLKIELLDQFVTSMGEKNARIFSTSFRSYMRDIPYDMSKLMKMYAYRCAAKSAVLCLHTRSFIDTAIWQFPLSRFHSPLGLNEYETRLITLSEKHYKNLIQGRVADSHHELHSSKACGDMKPLSAPSEVPAREKKVGLPAPPPVSASAATPVKAVSAAPAPVTAVSAAPAPVKAAVASKVTESKATPGKAVTATPGKAATPTPVKVVTSSRETSGSRRVRISHASSATISTPVIPNDKPFSFTFTSPDPSIFDTSRVSFTSNAFGSGAKKSQSSVSSKIPPANVEGEGEEPYTRPKRDRLQGTRPKGSSFNFPVKLKHYDLPRQLQTIKDSCGKDRVKALKELTKYMEGEFKPDAEDSTILDHNFRKYFSTVLYLEEVQALIDIRLYDLSGVKIQRNFKV